MATRRVIDSIQVPDRPTIQSPAGAERRVPGQVFGAGQASGIGDDPNSFEHVVDKYGGLTNVAGVATIDPKIARLSGEAMIAQVKAGNMSPHLKEALIAAQRRYPRLFGHVGAIRQRIPTPNGTVPVEFGSIEGMSRLSEHLGGQEKRMTDQFIAPGMSKRKTYDTVGHELAHAAQELRGGKTFAPGAKGANTAANMDFGNRYTALNKIRGYWDNPYETEATKAGNNFANRELAQKTADKMMSPLDSIEAALKKLGFFKK